ncbi:hypothetical protein [Solicola sp. PLA-1-18]|uniref:hypothetical protein n=1 Tax=Solicola sp. PLA-1-18 TaxID=3380532 RepID=UPI003B7B3D63
MTADDSTPERDGMMVEMWDSERGLLAEVFEDDATGERVVNAMLTEIPVAAMERLLSESSRRLDKVVPDDRPR